jgi:hypothetical protein
VHIIINFTVICVYFKELLIHHANCFFITRFCLSYFHFTILCNVGNLIESFCVEEKISICYMCYRLLESKIISAPNFIMLSAVLRTDHSFWDFKPHKYILTIILRLLSHKLCMASYKEGLIWIVFFGLIIEPSILTLSSLLNKGVYWYKTNFRLY